jgi:hypothetical protein
MEKKRSIFSAIICRSAVYLLFFLNFKFSTHKTGYILFILLFVSLIKLILHYRKQSTQDLFCLQRVV